MNEIIQNFQFIRPLWLLGLVPVVVVYVLKLKFGKHQNLWQQLLPQHLYQQLVISKGLQTTSRYIHYALFAWLMAVIGIAGPTWEKLPQAVYQTQAGKVILMDMSMSMLATDLTPNRLTRARFKAIDLIKQVSEGETGLVAYAGDAFVISPLTDDANTLISLIPSLRPEIMPSQGSSALSGLEIAADLLRNAGYQSGQIYWLTDGILYNEVKDIRRFIENSNYEVSALLVGTENGAPILLENGQLLKDRKGSIVVPSINSRYLNQAMSGTGGTYSIFANDNSDIASIKRKVQFEQQQKAQEVENTTGDIYKDMGPFLLLLVLPFAAYAFRRGLLALGLVCIMVIPPKPAFSMQTQDNSQVASNIEQSQAEGLENYTPSFTVSNWFKNADQKGKQAFDNENYEDANEMFEDPEWLAASAYKKGDYQQALDRYTQLGGLENTYNKANSLAKLGKLEDALAAYNEVIDADGKHANAIKNKAIVEALLEQQQEQEQQNSESDDQKSSEQQDSEQQDSEQNKDSDKSDSDQSQSESQESESQNNEQSDGKEQDSEQQNSDEKNTDEEGSEQDSDEQKSAEQEKQDENLKRQAQQQSEQEQQESQSQQDSKQQAEEQANQNAQQQIPQEQQQEAISADQFEMQNLTPEQKEEMQRMQMIMNKVPDDPAYLLQRKMMLEAYKRDRRPVPTQENW